jgi:hypothetical protein
VKRQLFGSHSRVFVPAQSWLKQPSGASAIVPARCNPPVPPTANALPVPSQVCAQLGV